MLRKIELSISRLRETYMQDKIADVTASLEQVNWLLDQAHERGVSLRLLGGLAFYLHCPAFNFIQIERRHTFSDMDFIGLYEQKQQIHDLFDAAGYASDRSIDEIPGVKRSI